jgi:hypothetical protein
VARDDGDAEAAVTGEHIRAELVRTGGFGGLELHSRLDTAELDEEQARELAALVGGLDLDKLGPGAPGQHRQPVPDAYEYELTVQRGGRRWEGTFGERDVPRELRPLVTALVRRGRQG